MRVHGWMASLMVMARSNTETVANMKAYSSMATNNA